MGLMCWSPPLDKMGNSVKGIHFCHVSSIALGVFGYLVFFFAFAADVYRASVGVAEIEVN